MLILFHSKAAAEVLMFAEHALPILKAAGKPYTTSLPERGVITSNELLQAIQGIEKAMANDVDNDYIHDDDAETREHPIQEHVSFRRRAFPLLAMLRLSNEHHADVTWEPAPDW